MDVLYLHILYCNVVLLYKMLVCMNKKYCRCCMYCSIEYVIITSYNHVYETCITVTKTYLLVGVNCTVPLVV